MIAHVHRPGDPSCPFCPTNRSNFFQQSNEFLQQLPNASWIAIDEEMTGISLPPVCGGSVKPSKGDSPEQRYTSMKAVPERYSIIQLGISLFEQKSLDDSGAVDSSSFVVRKYKFTLFPPADNYLTREITLNPSAIHFLQDNNLNLDAWVREGIPFCTGAMASNVVDRFLNKLEQRSNEPGPMTPISQQKRVVLTKDEDKLFHAQSMSGLREWLDTPLPIQSSDVSGEGISLLLPRCNTFLVRNKFIQFFFVFVAVFD